MEKIESMRSGSLKLGGDLYARRCEGGYELCRRDKHDGWQAYEVTPSRSDAVAWLMCWAIEMDKHGGLL